MSEQSITLRDELKNRYINFIDSFGQTQYIFDFKNNTLCGELTDWKEINIKENKKYRLISEIQNDRYYGNYNDGNYKNMAAIIYKVTYKKNIFSSKQKYIFMIIDNPFYNQESNKSAYKLIIFNLNKQGMYVNYLTDHSIFSSI
jgi:hypothetical protein